MISELIVITAHKKGKQPPEGKPEKKQKFQKTFGKFPICRWASTEVIPDPEIKGKYLPYRWEYIKKNHPDFDIFIDDNSAILSETREKFPDRTYCLPDYKCTRYLQAPNIYHVETNVSDIKDIDFALGALEYRIKKVEQGISKTKSTKKTNPSTPTWLIITPLISGILALLIWIEVWKSKPKR